MDKNIDIERTIPKARKRNAENDMNKNAKRQLIPSLHEVVDETEIDQDPEKPGKVTKVIYDFIIVYSLYLYLKADYKLHKLKGFMTFTSNFASDQIFMHNEVYI